VASDDLAVLAAFASPDPQPRAVIADPVRLPLVEAVADRALVGLGVLDDPAALRELWRVLAPAGSLVVAAPLPRHGALGSSLLTRLLRHRVTRRLTVHRLFEPVEVAATRTALVIRADKRDGLSPPPLTATVAGRTRHVPRVRTNTA